MTVFAAFVVSSAVYLLLRFWLIPVWGSGSGRVWSVAALRVLLQTARGTAAMLAAAYLLLILLFQGLFWRAGGATSAQLEKLMVWARQTHNVLSRCEDAWWYFFLAYLSLLFLLLIVSGGAEEARKRPEWKFFLLKKSVLSSLKRLSQLTSFATHGFLALSLVGINGFILVRISTDELFKIRNLQVQARIAEAKARGLYPMPDEDQRSIEYLADLVAQTLAANQSWIPAQKVNADRPVDSGVENQEQPIVELSHEDWESVKKTVSRDEKSGRASEQPLGRTDLMDEFADLSAGVLVDYAGPQTGNERVKIVFEGPRTLAESRVATLLSACIQFVVERVVKLGNLQRALAPLKSIPLERLATHKTSPAVDETHHASAAPDSTTAGGSSIGAIAQDPGLLRRLGPKSSPPSIHVLTRTRPGMERGSIFSPSVQDLIDERVRAATHPEEAGER
jgi:hypothetical protein